ncbi:FecR family protein [Caulobacter sp. KR2-114]|uniref:FecR family protein n=1 Tax=Caulobacter sp. KR2-114 TaxID=3400912 RepID=UPI003BFB335E
MSDEQRETRRRTDEAADWFTRMSSPRISNETLDGFWTWRRDPLNRAAYERVEQVAGLAGTLGSDPEIRAAVQQAISRRPWWRTLADGLSARRALLFTGGALVVAALAGGLFLLLNRGEEYSTGIGQQTTIKLSDGSSLRLDTDSRVRVHFEERRRLLTLEHGQAFFQVAHDSARPFIVDAGSAQVRAVGTEFDVRRSPDGVDVTLTQGRVQVTSPVVRAASWTLEPGQHIRVDRRGAAAAPTHADLQQATAWTTGRIFFHDTPLAEAAAELNRYNRRKITLAADAPATVRVNGAFDTGDVDGFVAAAADSLNLSAHRQADGGVELRPQPSSHE